MDSDNQEENNQNGSETITKTKAKKSLLLKFDKSEKSKLLKDIKKKYPECTTDFISDENGEKLLVEFSNYKEAKEAKSFLGELYKNDKIKIESQLHQIKKVKLQEKKEELKNKFVEQNGQHGDRSRNLFEIRVPKIIIRNISFNLNEEKLRAEMEKFGKVELVNLPKKENGKLSGFAFVVFENIKVAKQAIEGLNARKEKLFGTKVAADWCLPKNLFLKNTKIEEEKEKEEKEENGSDEEEGDDKEEEDEDEDKDSDQEEDEDDEESEEDDEDEDEEPKKKKSKKDNKQENPKEDEKFQVKKKDGTRDVQEKRTVFIRNLSFDAIEEDVKEAFSKFGPVKYVKLCYDRDLERPRGTAFIQFEDAQSALNACAESEIFELDMRKLQIDMAISRDQAHDIVEEKKAGDLKKDNRNLELAKEGIIYPNSYEGKNLSKADLIRRQKLEAENAAKLKILHYFVSPTRLSVHNIPIKCTDEELRAIFQKAISNDDENTKGKNQHHRSGIKECRIMRDLKRVNSEGVCRSKGYGFVEFATFELAKKALHATNNNPNLFPNDNRLIVQFSIEDMRALKKKEARIEKSKLKLERSERFKQRRFKKLDKPKEDTHIDGLDMTENVDKIKRQNMVKVHLLERKLSKKKEEEEKKKIKKQNKAAFNEKKVVEKIEKSEKKQEIMGQLKKNRRKAKNLNKKLANKKAALKTVDNVDKLVDKLYNSKNKIERKKKWFE